MLFRSVKNRTEHPPIDRHQPRAGSRVSFVLSAVIIIGVAVVFQASAQTTRQFVIPSDEAAYKFLGSHWTVAYTVVGGIAGGYMKYYGNRPLFIPVTELTSRERTMVEGVVYDNYMYQTYPQLAQIGVSQNASALLDTVYDSGTTQIFLVTRLT